MHELSVAQALLDQVEAIAGERGAVIIHAVTIQVGPLSGVEPDLLMRAFEVARLAREMTEQATLTIEAVEVRVTCTDCGCEGAAAPGNLVCLRCTSHHTRLLQGEELLLRRVEFDIPDPAESAPGECHV